MDRTKSHTVYYNKENKIIPSVTGIISQNLGWNKQALIRWAVKEVKDGHDPFKVVEKACDVGTITHYLIECYLKNEKPNLTDFAESDIITAKQCFNQYLQWAKYRKLILIGSEISIVSEKYQVGGTIDKIIKVEEDNTIILMDFKTSIGVYPDHKIQISAYGAIWNENNPDMKIDEFHLLQFGKVDNSFHHHIYMPEALKNSLKVFLYLRKIHDLQKLI